MRTPAVLRFVGIAGLLGTAPLAATDGVIEINQVKALAGGVTTGSGFVDETGTPPDFTVEVRDIVPYDPNSSTTRFMRLRISSP